MRIAVSDIGTNSVRLLIAQCQPIFYRGNNQTKGNISKNNWQITRLESILVTTRLGNTEQNRLTESAMDKTVEAIKCFCQKVQQYDARLVKVVATSAARDAENGSELIKRIAERCAIQAEIISGEQEAYYSFKGVQYAVNAKIKKDILVIDLGGGSTEFIWNDRKGKLFVYSLPLGAVRMTVGKHSDEQIAAIGNQVFELIKVQRPAIAVGAGGTITTLAAAAQQLPDYNPEKIHGYNLYYAQVENILERIQNKNIDEIASMPGVSRQRADIITAGARIVKIIMKKLNYQHIIVSDADILYGLLLDVLENNYLTK